MRKFTRRPIAALGALALMTGAATAQSKQKVSIAVGGAGCLCYLPTVLAKQLGEFDKAGLDIELINFKGGSDALKAVIGGSADVVSGYYDHCVNLAAKGQSLQSFVVYDRYPGMVLAVSPENKDIKSIKDLAGKAVGVSAPGSSTDFFLKYLLAKNGMDPTSASVVGIGLDATAVAAMAPAIAALQENGVCARCAGAGISMMVSVMEISFARERVYSQRRAASEFS